jgi:PAS domain S-box-containing protein
MRNSAPGQGQFLSNANYFRVLLENTLDVVTVLKPNGTVLYTNPAISLILGYDFVARPGKNIFDFIHPEDSATVRRTFDEIIGDSGAVARVEFRYRHHDGSWRDFEALSRNLLDNPDVRAIVVNARDITSRKRAEHALLVSEAALRESHTELVAVTARLLKVEEDELKRIAREIHDDLSQRLALVSVDIDQLAGNLPANREETRRRLKHVDTQLARLADDLHRMAHQLHPSMLEDLGLIAALRSHCRDLSKGEDIAISFAHHGTLKNPPKEVVLCVYRVAQEALRNVIRHSNARRAEVSLSTIKGIIRLRVRDFGKGFREGKNKRGLGLLSMEERVRLVGGTFSVSSEPGDGTVIEAEFPIRG